MPIDSLDFHGCHVIDPGVALPKYGLNPKFPDAQVRCLCYLMSKIPGLNLAPPEAEFRVIPVEYLGGPYPAIGMYTETFVDTDERLTLLTFDIGDQTFDIGDQLASLVSEMGIERLLELSSTETRRWQDILGAFPPP